MTTYHPPRWITDIMLKGAPPYSNNVCAYASHPDPNHLRFIIHADPDALVVDPQTYIPATFVDMLCEIVLETSPIGRLIYSIRDTPAHTHFADVIARLLLVLVDSDHLYPAIDTIVNLLTTAILTIFTFTASPYISSLYTIVHTTAFLSRLVIKSVIASFHVNPHHASRFLVIVPPRDRVACHGMSTDMSITVDKLVSVARSNAFAAWSDSISIYMSLVTTHVLPVMRE